MDGEVHQDCQDNCHNVKVKGHNNPTGHRSHGRLMYPDSMKQFPFIVFEQWPEQKIEGECNIFKAEGQKGHNNITAHKFHAILISPKHMKQISFIVSEYW